MRGYCVQCRSVVEDEGGYHVVPEHHHACDPLDGCVGERPVPAQCGPVEDLLETEETSAMVGGGE